MGKAQKLSVTYRPIAELVPYAGNARTHSEEQVEQLRRSISVFGFTNPILVDEENGVIAGHGRLQAAIGAGLLEVPTIVLKGLTDAQKRAYTVADNKLALNADWDFKQLTDELMKLDTGEIDLRLTGFSDEELEDVITWVPPEEKSGKSKSNLDCTCPTCGRKHKSKSQETAETV